MIALSMLLVVVGFVLLMLGVLGVGDDPLLWVYASIGACLVAAVLLAIGVFRRRPSRRPIVGSAEGGASWAGASPTAAAEAEATGEGGAGEPEPAATESDTDASTPERPQRTSPPATRPPRPGG